MNWIAEQFEKLQARVEAHIPAAHKALNDVSARMDQVESNTQSGVAGAVSYVGQAVTSMESKISSAESRVRALELQVAALMQAKAAP